jgi:hypothetical protein
MTVLTATHPILRAFCHHPGFPGFGDLNASQTLAYMADMLENS